MSTSPSMHHMAELIFPSVSYSYIATVPLLVLFSVAMTSIKYMEGLYDRCRKSFTSNGQSRLRRDTYWPKYSPSKAKLFMISDLVFTVIPRPFSLWQPQNRAWLLPLYFLLSIGWSLELYGINWLQLQEQLINHLTMKCYSFRRYFQQYSHELPSHPIQSWPSGYFFCIRAQASGTGFIVGNSGHGILVFEFFFSILGLRLTRFVLGSMVAILGMPLTTLVTRRELQTVCGFQCFWPNDISQ